MTTKTWFGGTGRFDNPADWSPNGVPQAGDVANIITGTVVIAEEDVRNAVISIGYASSTLGPPPDQPALNLRDATVGDVRFVSNVPAKVQVNGWAKINVTGQTTITGTMSSYRTIGYTDMRLADNSVLLNTGTIVGGEPGTTFSASGTSHFNIAAGTDARLVNNGTIAARDGILSIACPVTGTGSIILQHSVSAQDHFDSVIELKSFVGQHQTVEFVGPPVQFYIQMLQIDTPMQFLAPINGFEVGDTIELANTNVTSELYSN